MGFYLTDHVDDAPLPQTCVDPKPLRGPTRGVISGYRYLNPDTGRWLNKEPLGERVSANLFGFVATNPVLNYDLLGLLEQAAQSGIFNFNVVSKSFIAKIQQGEVGRLNPRIGIPPPILLLFPQTHGLAALIVNPFLADFRLKQFSALASDLFPAFNENPRSDARDGEYRLFAAIDLVMCCQNNNLIVDPFKEDKDGGVEMSGFGQSITGTSNLSADIEQTSSSSIQLSWTTWGRPASLVEPGMQAVGMRRSPNIWHSGKINFTCDAEGITASVVAFTGSQFPSRRLWINSELVAQERQGDVSALWRPDPDRPGLIAP